MVITNNSDVLRVQKRAVLVFFQSEKVIDAFCASEYGQRLMSHQPKEAVKVTEKTKNLKHYVTRATLAGAVTMFPRIFGRAHHHSKDAISSFAARAALAILALCRSRARFRVL